MKTLRELMSIPKWSQLLPMSDSDFDECMKNLAGVEGIAKPDKLKPQKVYIYKFRHGYNLLGWLLNRSGYNIVIKIPIKFDPDWGTETFMYFGYYFNNDYSYSSHACAYLTHLTDDNEFPCEKYNVLFDDVKDVNVFVKENSGDLTKAVK